MLSVGPQELVVLGGLLLLLIVFGSASSRVRPAI
jgi:hypothetical protein